MGDGARAFIGDTHAKGNNSKSRLGSVNSDCASASVHRVWKEGGKRDIQPPRQVSAASRAFAFGPDSVTTCPSTAYRVIPGPSRTTRQPNLNAFKIVLDSLPCRSP